LWICYIVGLVDKLTCWPVGYVILLVCYLCNFVGLVAMLTF
jgi:hypothetical protein